jgi:RNA ligase (TIGR02306 family)
MHATDFGWGVTESGGIYDGNETHYPEDESRFLTEKLGVTYADAEDNQRKAPSADKYKKMAQRHPNIFKKSWARWLMKREWGRKIMFFFFGKKKDKKNGWPSWVAKTDEERIQNMPWILNDTGRWIITEKIDGSSTTFTMKRGKRGKNEFYVCSRNVCFDSVDKPCYYDTNIYWEMAQKYDMYNVLSKLLEWHEDAEWVTVQGETYGAGVQKRDYSRTDHDFKAFNLIFSNTGRYGTREMETTLGGLHVPCVPVVNDNFYFDEIEGENKVDSLLEMATGESAVDGKPREGFVLRSADGTRSFKAVSNSFLLKYHS